jgi:hypothetical protein
VQTVHFACGTGSARVVLERYTCKRGRGCDFWPVAASSWELLPDTGTRVYRAVSADRIKGARYRLSVEVSHSTVEEGRKKPRPGASSSTYSSNEVTL